MKTNVFVLVTIFVEANVTQIAESKTTVEEKRTWTLPRQIPGARPDRLVRSDLDRFPDCVHPGVL